MVCADALIQNVAGKLTVACVLIEHEAWWLLVQRGTLADLPNDNVQTAVAAQVGQLERVRVEQDSRRSDVPSTFREYPPPA